MAESDAQRPEPLNLISGYTHEELALAAKKAYQAHLNKEAPLKIRSGLVSENLLRQAFLVKSRVPPTRHEKFDVHELYNEEVDEGDVYALPMLLEDRNLTFVLLTNNPDNTRMIDNFRRRMVAKVYSSFQQEE